MTVLVSLVVAVVVGLLAGAWYGRFAWSRRDEGRSDGRGWAVLAGVGALPLMALDDRVFVPLAGFVLAAMLAMIVVIRVQARDELPERGARHP